MLSNLQEGGGAIAKRLKALLLKEKICESPKDLLPACVIFKKITEICSKIAQFLLMYEEKTKHFLSSYLDLIDKKNRPIARFLPTVVTLKHTRGIKTSLLP